MYRKILVPLDGSKLSECVMEHVRTVATGCRALDIVLLSVIEKDKITFPDGLSERTMQEVGEELDRQAIAAKMRASDYLSKTADELKSIGANIQTEVIPAHEVSAAADIILNYARENAVDLIVMSTHGRSGISRWAFGSVTDKIVRQSRVPVLTISPAGCRI